MDDPQNRKPVTKALVVRTVQEARQLMLATDARLMTPQIQEYWLHMEMEQQKIEMSHIITYVSCGVPRSRVCKGGSA